MPSSNPALNANTFATMYAREVTGARMTLQGTVAKTGVLLGCVTVTAIFAWIELLYNGAGVLYPLMLVGAIGGMAVAFVTIFKKSWAPVTAPLYALLEGLFLGAISVVFEAIYPGIFLEAFVLTFAVAGVMLLCYATGVIKPSQNFRMGVAAATGGIMVFYLISIVMSFAFHYQVPFLSIYDSSPLSIGISVFIVAIAALNLVIDFDFIEQGAENGAPKFMEWYAAFGLMVTLIWLYIEILRLLAKTRSR